MASWGLLRDCETWIFAKNAKIFPALVHGGDRTQLLHWQLNYDHPRHKLKHIVNYKLWGTCLEHYPIHTQYIVSVGEKCNNESVLVRNVEANTSYSESRVTPINLPLLTSQQLTQNPSWSALYNCVHFCGVGCVLNNKKALCFLDVVLMSEGEN